MILALSIIIQSCNNSDPLAIVDYRIEGCFASGKSKIILYKVENSTMAKIVSDREKSQEVKLNSLQLDDFNLFIKELKDLKEDERCTTVGYYKVSIDNKTINKIDGSCSWNGFQKLKKSLFNIN